jgi:hypothetical protein
VRFDFLRFVFMTHGATDRKIVMGWRGLRVERRLGCCKELKKGDSSKDRHTKRPVNPQAIGRYENLERSVFLRCRSAPR